MQILVMRSCPTYARSFAKTASERVAVGRQTDRSSPGCWTRHHLSGACWGAPRSCPFGRALWKGHPNRVDASGQGCGQSGFAPRSIAYEPTKGRPCDQRAGGQYQQGWRCCSCRLSGVARCWGFGIACLRLRGFAPCFWKTENRLWGGAGGADEPLSDYMVRPH